VNKRGTGLESEKLEKIPGWGKGVREEKKEGVG